MSNDKFYNLLSINKAATDVEIKKAYKTAALKFHPDRNPDNRDESEKKFKDISEAYEVLNDPEKRQIYDQFGEEGLKGRGGGGSSPFDIFEQMFGGQGMGRGRGQGMGRGMGGGMGRGMGGGMFDGLRGSPFEGMFGGGGGRERDNKSVPDTQISIKISYKDMMLGSDKKIKIRRKIIQNRNSMDSCKKCKGKGKIVNLVQIAPGMVTQSVSDCRLCNGVGHNIKYLEKDEIITITIPKGAQKGEYIKINNKGNEGYNNNGHLIVVFEEETIQNVGRDTHDLVLKKQILLSEALGNLEFIFNHPSKDNIVIKSSAIIKPNTIKTIKGLGFPIKNSVREGDLIIQFDIIFPDKISFEKLGLIHKLLPIRVVDTSKTTGLNDYYLEDFNSSESRANDVDRGREPENSEGVQCQTQ
uniref:J domain-containing protein n=1 Tax=viral metagenome TaxID=1070528 RepID=A0A6C0EIU0_9ZZZZ